MHFMLNLTADSPICCKVFLLLNILYMKYNININQIKCIEFWLNLQQWAIMDIMSQLSTWADTINTEQWIYYYLSPWKLINEIPIISNNKNTFQKQIKKLKDKWLLEHYHEQSTMKWYYRLSALWKTFTLQEKNPVATGKKSSTLQEKNPVATGKKSSTLQEKNPHNNNTNYNNTNYTISSSSSNEDNKDIANVKEIANSLTNTSISDNMKEERDIVNGKNKEGEKSTINKSDIIITDKDIVNGKNNAAASETANDIYLYYTKRAFSKKNWHKLALSIERIKDALKKYTEWQIINAIDLYKLDKKVSIQQQEWQYIKSCENFFWYERGSKIKFIVNFIRDESEIQAKQEIETTPVTLEDKDNVDWL